MAEKTIELLSPAGDMERLRMSLAYGAAAAHRRANRFPATVVPVNWDTFSKLPRFAAHLVMRCRVRCEHRAAR